MKKLIFILPLLYYSCTDDIIADIDALQTENAEQDAQIDSLLTVLTEQQAYIDSLNDAQNIADSLNNLTMQSYIDSLINEGELTDSLLQVYTDSLNTVQNTYIDSLHNAQQTTLEALANSALNAGFVETEVYSGSISGLGGTNNDIQGWYDLDLSSYIGSTNSIVLIRITNESSTSSFSNGGINIGLRKNGATNPNTEVLNNLNVGYDKYYFVNTDSLGIIEWAFSIWGSYTNTIKFSSVFYLNQNDTINP